MSLQVGWHPDAVPHAQREAGLPGGRPAQQLPDRAPRPPGDYHRHRVSPLAQLPSAISLSTGQGTLAALHVLLSCFSRVRLCATP